MTTMSFIRQNNVVLTAWSHCRNAEQRVTVKYQKSICISQRLESINVYGSRLAMRNNAFTG